ncbi:MAG: acyl carrier protein [Stackebrandtia sp.]
MDTTFTTMLKPFLKFLDGQELTPDSNLPELGLDSMQAVELLFAVEDEFGIELPDDKLTDSTFETAGSLWGAIEQVRA